MVPNGPARTIGTAVVQYVADRGHGHEGGHRIALAGRDVLVLPDGRTTAKNRSHVITRVLHAAEEAERTTEDALESLIGALVLSGATNITLDGIPFFDGGETPIVSVRLDITQQDDRTLAVSVASMGAG